MQEQGLQDYLPRPPAGLRLEAIRSAVSSHLDDETLELPLLPAVAGRVLSLARSQDTRAAELAGVIHSDQSLVSHVLKVGNSAAYGWNSQIVSLHQAVARLGFERIAEIALAVAVGGRLFRLDGKKAELQKLWNHSVAAAFCAQEAACLLRLNAETAFLCGLLHDIGKPVVLEAVQAVEKSLGCDLEAEIAVVLMEEFGSSVGARLGREWGLPQQVQEAIACRDCYQDAVEYPDEAKLVCVADLLSDHLLDEKSDEDVLRAHPVFVDLNLYPDDVDSLLSKKESVLEAVESMQL